MRIYSTTIALLSFVMGLLAQELPSTSIVIFELDRGAEITLTNAKFLTKFNPEGYNNQPAFFDENTLYISSDWKAKGKTDIVKLNLLRKAVLKVTHTVESEYSPTLGPDPKSFTVVTLPEGTTDNPAQFIWEYPLDRSHEGEILSYDISNVGYQCWINRNEIALFLVDDPSKLSIYNTETQKSKDIDENIGRCLKVNSNGELIYVHKTGYNIWYFKSYDSRTGEKNVIGETRPGSEDFEILDDGSFIMAEQSRIYLLSQPGGWREIDNLRRLGIDNISRIAAYGNKIAIVFAT